MDDDPLQKKALSSFKWNKAKLDAVHLLADDELTDQEIADKVSVRRNTLWVWKKNPVFAAKLKEETEHLGDVAQRYAIGRRSRRLAAQNNRWERMQRLVEERSQAAEMQDATGGKTGLLTRDQKSIGGRDNAEKVDVY